MSVRLALMFSVVSRYVSLALRAVGFVVIARLLTPGEIGVFATAAALVALLFIFVEFGLHNYLIQARRLTKSIVRSAVGLSLALSMTATGLLLLAALAIPDAVFDPRLKIAVLLVGGTAALEPLVLPIQAKLQRDMRFDRLGFIAVGRSVVQVCAAIALAANGFGFYSLVLAAFLESLTGIVLAVVLGGNGRFVAPSLHGWKPILRFGGSLALAGGLKRVGDTGTTVLIGSTLGYSAVGVFDRAQIMTNLVEKGVVGAVEPVILPILSRTVRQGRNLKQAYLVKISHLTAIQWPLFAVSALLAEPIVRVLLGPQWMEAVPVLRVLAIAGLFLPFSSLSVKFFVALDAIDVLLRIQTATVCARLAAAAALSFVSLPAVALAAAVGTGTRTALMAGPLKRRIGYTWRDIWKCCRRSATITAMACIGPATMVVGFDHGAPADVAVLVAGSLLAGSGWVLGLAMTRHELMGELTRLRGAGRRLVASPFPRRAG